MRSPKDIQEAAYEETSALLEDMPTNAGQRAIAGGLLEDWEDSVQQVLAGGITAEQIARDTLRDDTKVRAIEPILIEIDSVLEQYQLEFALSLAVDFLSADVSVGFDLVTRGMNHVFGVEDF